MVGKVLAAAVSKLLRAGDAEGWSPNPELWFSVEGKSKKTASVAYFKVVIPILSYSQILSLVPIGVVHQQGLPSFQWYVL